MSELNRHHKTLELPRILSMLGELAGCQETKELALALRPACDYREAKALLERTRDASYLSGKYGGPSIYGLVPIVPILERARVGSMLSMKELLMVALMLRTARNLCAWRRLGGEEEGSSLDGFFARLVPDRPLEEEITRAILSEDEIFDHASPELYDIRRRMRGAGQKARELLERIIRSSTYQKYLQEQIITIRNGRFVVPVRSECRGEIQGLVHDTSSSGATVFVEPMAVVEQNNLIRELEGKEQAEITRILLAFTGRVGEQAQEQILSYRAMLELDLIFAKSRLADRMRATIPILSEEGETRLKRARHPLIPGERVVPIDILLGGEFDTLVITGPNTGGKTVALKTLGLLTLMASCGLMIPAAEESKVRY
ncbi:MAG: endonuclease MutS2, partial [Oscillospiraceae bacterium]|nr:endonuclease MutS2 [Oscillospiraceae bacterium]